MFSILWAWGGLKIWNCLLKDQKHTNHSSKTVSQQEGGAAYNTVKRKCDLIRIMVILLFVSIV